MAFFLKHQDAGKKYGIVPGAPNQIRRLEGGMLSFGSDIPFGLSAVSLNYLERNALQLPHVASLALFRQRVEAPNNCLLQHYPLHAIPSCDMVAFA